MEYQNEKIVYYGSNGKLRADLHRIGYQSMLQKLFDYESIGTPTQIRQRLEFQAQEMAQSDAVIVDQAAEVRRQAVELKKNERIIRDLVKVINESEGFKWKHTQTTT